MKRVIQILCVLFISVAVNAGVIESFDYAAGDLTDQNGGTGWTSSWRNSYSRNGGNYVVSGTGLSHDAVTAMGNSSYSPGDGTRYQRDLDAIYADGIVYMSFLMKCTTSADDPYSAVELQSGTDADPGRVFQVGILRKDDGLDPGNGGNAEFYATSRDGIGGGRLNSVKIADFDDATNLYVVRFDLDADTASLFFNPDDTVDLSSGGIALDLFSGITFDRVGLANFVGGNGTYIDELYIGADAPVLVPEPATISMLALGVLCLNRKK